MAPKIAVLYGGLSTEREVSLRTGKAVYDACTAKGYETVLLDVDRDLSARLTEVKPDVAFIALHGKYGEDGCVQGLLEILGIPYTGPGVMASAVAMNKNLTKKILAYEGIPTPKFVVIDGQNRDASAITGEILAAGRPPLVIKAAKQGSSIGVCFAHSDEEVTAGVAECLKYDHEILVEEFIKGRELTVAVLGNADPVALPILEIVSTTGVYDYHAKYSEGASSHFVPDLPPEVAARIQELAVRTYKAVGCIGLSRVDFMLPDDNQPLVLEVNTSPGMTATSLFPDAAKAAGISFPELADRLIKLALEAHPVP